MGTDIIARAMALKSGSGVSQITEQVNKHTNNTDIHVTSNEKTAWNNKYDLPETKIPKTDLSEEVQTSLGKADTINLLINIPENHNNIFRGDDLFAKSYTIDDICSMISDGSFSDIYIGDYFTLSDTIENVPCYVEETDTEGTKTMVESTQTVTYNTKFRVAGLDTYLNTGNTSFTAHHAVIVPDGIIGSNRMNSTNITTGGYVGSFMYTSVIPVYDTHFSTKLRAPLITQ